jgi:hypothetical protein
LIGLDLPMFHPRRSRHRTVHPVNVGSCQKRHVQRKVAMLTPVMLRRLLFAAIALSLISVFVVEGLAVANTRAAAHSKAATSAPGGWIYG